MKILKLVKWTLIAGVTMSILLMFTANYLVNKQTKGQVYSSVDSIPKNRVGLLLGTSKHLRSGN